VFCSKLPVLRFIHRYYNEKQRRPKAPPATQNASQKSSGDKNKEVRGTKFKIVVTRCHILRLKCTKFDFGWGSSQRSPDPLAEFEGSILLREGNGREGKGRGGEEKEDRGRKGREKGEWGKKGRGRLHHGFWGMDAPDEKRPG